MPFGLCSEGAYCLRNMQWVAPRPWSGNLAG